MFIFIGWLKYLELTDNPKILFIHMKNFIFKVLLFALPVIGVPVICIIHFGSPPPKLSTSMSFNAKILNIKEKKLGPEVDILSVGSSMSLNNIHTLTVKKYLGSKYFNISSWGQNIEEDYNLIKIFTKHYKPKIIMISCGYMDFNNNFKDIKYDLIDNYLFGNGLLVYKELNFKYLLAGSRRYFLNKKDTLSYSSLMYDDCGGINFENTNFIREQDRWTGLNIKELYLDTTQYNYLDSIARLCRTQNIRLYIIQSPYRKGYYSQLDKYDLNTLHTHENKVDSIVKKNNQIFISTTNRLWEDSLFVDYSHFNKTGSELYTTYFLEKINTGQTLNRLDQ
jgi:hypothetical protein